METSSFKHNWIDYKYEEIVGGKNADGSRYLEQFLIDYTSLFGEKVNAGCSNCLKEYYRKYKQKITAMSNISQYKLKTKYNGIPLEFGSQIFVTNANITDAYAKKLLKHYSAETIFEVYPAPKKEVETKSKSEK